MSSTSLRSKLTWFLSEFIVVVTGVLVALALNAWWQVRQDRSFELQYLQQLNREIEQTIDILEREDKASSGPHRALTMLVRSARMNPKPPRDSLVAWSLEAPNISQSNPILGTAEAIVASGDLRLISDDSLRLAIPAFLDAVKGRREDQQGFRRQFLDGVRDVSSLIDYMGLVQEVIPPSIVDSIATNNPLFALPAGGATRTHTTDIEEILSRPDAYALFSHMHILQQNLRGIRQKMLSEYRTMSVLVEKALP